MATYIRPQTNGFICFDLQESSVPRILPVFFKLLPIVWVPRLLDVLVSEHSLHKWNICGLFPFLKGKTSAAIHFLDSRKNNFHRPTIATQRQWTWSFNLALAKFLLLFHHVWAVLICNIRCVTLLTLLSGRGDVSKGKTEDKNTASYIIVKVYLFAMSPLARSSATQKQGFEPICLCFTKC